MSQTTTGHPAPAPISVPGAGTNGKARRRSAKGKSVKANAATRRAQQHLGGQPGAAPIAATKIPRAAGMPQPRAGDRMARTVTVPSSGITAQTSVFTSFLSDFSQSLTNGKTAPPAELCTEWVATFSSHLKMIQATFAAAAAA